jgi:hypothetical protein
VSFDPCTVIYEMDVLNERTLKYKEAVLTVLLQPSSPLASSTEITTLEPPGRATVQVGPELWKSPRSALKDKTESDSILGTYHECSDRGLPQGSLEGTMITLYGDALVSSQEILAFWHCSEREYLDGQQVDKFGILG